MLITERNILFSKWLKTHCPTDRNRYVMKRSEVAGETCKSAWFRLKAGEVEEAVKRGRGVWRGLRELQ